MSTNKTELNKRASKIKSAIVLSKGNMPEPTPEGQEPVAGTISAQTIKTHILEDMKGAVQELDSIRTGNHQRRGVDLSFAQYVKEKWGFGIAENGTPESFYHALNINPSNHTVASLMTMPEMPEGYRWIVPEVIRTAIMLGLRKQPIYGGLTAMEETVTQPSTIMPHINMSSGAVRRLGESETIPTGTVSFGQKTVRIHKYGTGLKISDEVIQFVSLNLLSLYMQDVGVQLGIGMDSLAIDTLINGEQAGGTEAAPVVGVTTAGTITYKDILRVWLRMGRLGRIPTSMLSDEDAALDILLLEEFKGMLAGTATFKNLDLKTPIPQASDYYVHGSMPSGGKLMLVDKTAALIKLNVGSLKIESERIAERQLQGTYVTVQTGFANMYRDARVIIDKTQLIGAAGFPSYMDINAYEQSNALIS